MVSRGLNAESDYISKRLNEIRNTNYSELISRPVQAKMLTDIAIDPLVELYAFTRYELYDIFITRIIEREQEKSSRRYFSYAQRRDFIRRVAWWLWTKSGLTGFHAESIPENIITDFIKEDEMDHDDIKRDLLSGSILERKMGDKFFFPHRSFQEFLVAEFIQNTEWNNNDLIHISKALNPEILNFIKESNNYTPIILLFNQLDDAGRNLSISFLDLIAWSLNASNYNIDDSAEAKDNPWKVIAKTLCIIDKDKMRTESVLSYIVKSFSNVISDSSKAMCLICLFILAEPANQEQKEIIYRNLAVLILTKALPSIEKLVYQSQTRGKFGVHAGMDNYYMDFVIEGFSGIIPSSTAKDEKEIIIAINLHNLYTYIEKFLATKCEIEELRGSLSTGIIQLRVSSLAQADPMFSMTEKGAIIAAFFRKYDNPKSLIKIEKKHKFDYPRNFPKWAQEDASK